MSRDLRMLRLKLLLTNELRRLHKASRRSTISLVAFALVAGLLIYASLIYSADEEIYRIATDNETIAGIITLDPKSEVVKEDYDVLVSDELKIQDTDKGLSAFKNLLDSFSAYNQNKIGSALASGTINDSRAFPVWVVMLPMDELRDRGDAFDETELEEQEQERQMLEEQRQRFASRQPGSVRAAVEDTLAKADFGELTTPDQMGRILPINSIIISLIVLTPLIFISTLYNNSFFEEKIQKKATLLFISPLSRLQVIAGKSLPYIAGSVILIMPFLFYLQPKLIMSLSLLPLASIVLLYLSCNFMLTVFSRSYKEMSFLKTTFGSVFIAYMLLPTLFMEITDISFISPLTSIAYLAEHATVPAIPYLFSFLPMLAAGLIIYYFASRLFCEENYYSLSSMTDKAFEMVAAFITRPRRVAYFTLLSFPLILVIEMVFLMLVALPTQEAGFLFVLLILVAAVVEELFKNISIYLVYERNLFDVSPLKLGIYSGVAFAAAEKGLLLFMMPELVGVLSKISAPAAFLPIVALAIPFIFHSLTCIMFGYVFRQTKSRLAFALPVALHLAYGLSIYMVFG